MPSLPISLDALQVLDAIERRGSFAAAAEELQKVTSAVSYTVQKTEEQLGVTLFQRTGRRSELTRSGRWVLEEGRRILAATAQLADQARALEAGWEPRLRIALDSNGDRESFFPALEQLLQEVPDLEVDVQETVLNGSWEALEFDQVDVVVGAPAPAPRHRGFQIRALEPVQMILVAAPAHPAVKALAIQGASPEALIEHRRVVMHDTSQRQVLRTAGLQLGRRVLYVQTIDQKRRALLGGLGIGHLPAHLAVPLLAEGRLASLQAASPLPSEEASLLAWKTTNKGRALKRLVALLSRENPGGSVGC